MNFVQSKENFDSGCGVLEQCTLGLDSRLGPKLFDGILALLRLRLRLHLEVGRTVAGHVKVRWRLYIHSHGWKGVQWKEVVDKDCHRKSKGYDRIW